MFNDEDFFMNDDELAEDNQPTLVDSAILDLLKSIEDCTSKMRDHIRFNERSEVLAQTDIMAGYMDSLIKLNTIDIEGLSEEEVYEEIDKVLKSTTELTFANMNEILPEEEIAEAPEAKDTADDTGTDW